MKTIFYLFNNNKMEHVFYKKYLKYKNKYINLKIYKKGGAIKFETINDLDLINDFVSPLKLPIHSTKITYNIDDNIIHIIRIILNQDDKPALFVLGGMSHKSFLGTSSVVLSKLDELKTKFKEVYFVEYDSFKTKQIDACGKRDMIQKESKEMKEIYQPELDMNSEIACYIHNIITKELKLNNVHLLGKCNGAWISLLLLIKDPIYMGLYLAVPGIPFNVDILNELEQDRLKKINFVFGWVKQDGYEFNWGIESFNENKLYDTMIINIEETKRLKLKYISYMYDNGKSVDPKKHHEIDPQMIDDIILSLI